MPEYRGRNCGSNWGSSWGSNGQTSQVDEAQEQAMCIQRHVHEVQGSVKIAEPNTDPHNHRFCTVSGQAQRISDDKHVHEVCFRTDFYEDHFHEFKGRSCPNIDVGGGKHVHLAFGMTSENEGHRHEFIVASLIEDPIGD